MSFRSLASFTFTALLGASCLAQMVPAQTAHQEPTGEMKSDSAAPAKKPLASPAETAEVSLRARRL